MTEAEKAVARALRKCTYVPGTAPKRFARDMASAAEHRPDLELTGPQRKYLFDMLHRFRRQIPEAHALYCQPCAMGGRDVVPRQPHERRPEG
jgi:hypothetical protein